MEKEKSNDSSIYEVPREIFIIEPPLELVTHPMEEVYRQCQSPYYKHKRGCPNFGKKETCPPNFELNRPKSNKKEKHLSRATINEGNSPRKVLKHITEKYDMSTLHLLVLKFDFGLYIERKREDHPDWTNRALANLRHWQGHLRSQCKKYWEEVGKNYEGYVLENTPEGRGVNLIETLSNYGIDLTWCVEDGAHEYISWPESMYHVYLFGKPLEEIDQ